MVDVFPRDRRASKKPLRAWRGCKLLRGIPVNRLCPIAARLLGPSKDSTGACLVYIKIHGVVTARF